MRITFDRSRGCSFHLSSREPVFCCLKVQIYTCYAALSQISVAKAWTSPALSRSPDKTYPWRPCANLAVAVANAWRSSGMCTAPETPSSIPHGVSPLILKHGFMHAPKRCINSRCISPSSYFHELQSCLSKTLARSRVCFSPLKVPGPIDMEKPSAVSKRRMNSTAWRSLLAVGEVCTSSIARLSA